MLDTIATQIFLLLVVSVAVFAFWKGDEPERFAMGAYLLGWMASMLVQDDGNLFLNFQWPLFALDLGMLAVLGGLGWRTRRAWPVWAAALQLLIVTSHLVFVFNVSASMAAFYTVVNLASYGVLVVIGVGTFWAWQERKAAGLE